MRALKKLIYNSSFRANFFQGLIVILILSVGYYLYSNTVENLRQMELPFGFDFLGSTAGFNIGWSIIPYDPTMSYGRVYLVGIVNTLLLSVLIIIFSTVLGFVVGIMRLSKNFMVSQLARWYVEFVRNVPLLIQIVFWFIVVFSTLPSPRQSYRLFDTLVLNNRGFYFPAPIFEANFLWSFLAIISALVGAFALLKWSQRYRKYSGKHRAALLPSLFALVLFVALIFVFTGKPLHWAVPTLQGFNFHDGFNFPISFLAAFVSMTIYRSATIGEAVRAGIQSIDKGQREAASAIGFPPFKTLRLIIGPQAARAILPPMINAWLTIVKESSLAVAVGFPELVSVFMQTSLNQTGRAIEIVLMVMGFYMCISLLISFLLNLYNTHIQMQEG
ncbi:amino acid ABC transporter permease [Geopsychrobacter electrodiphilus]|uniref:amino acid ABC transporter permease n=1 Tax=Geopsychrobacter electrodiphilus TaxID=225196 RepID=UPI0003652A3B|nr:ABC transporter permease subunit [Geopsychrobacter electrodiphilus]